MARFTVAVGLIFVVGTMIAVFAPGNLFAILQSIGFIGLLVSLFYYGWRLIKWLSRRMLWKVRNRIIISFAFIGVIPVLILALMGFYSMTFIFRQLSVIYLQNQFEHLEDELHNTGEKVVLRYYQSDIRGEGRIEELLRQERQALLDLRPQLSNTRFLLLRRVNRRGETAFEPVWAEPPLSAETGVDLIPYWARDGFHGLTTLSGQLYFRSVLPLREQDRDYLIFLDLPMDADLREYIKQRTSLELSLFDLADRGRAGVDHQVQEFFKAQGGFFEVTWAHILQPFNWANPVNSSTMPHGALIRVHLRSFFQRFFSTGEVFSSFIPIVLGVLVVVFVLVEFLSLLIGIAIVRNITRSIHNLYAGTQQIQKGNFDFRIPAGDRDQLDSMAAAFNRMSESVVQLMSQVSDKERLEKEVEIAREVQTHLFPRELPSVARVELAGSCLPARHVSGDYYDFIPWGDHLLDVIVADISGKGISAALLMANLQSTIRTHVAYYQAGRNNGRRPMADVVGAINRQMYVHTAPDKFATLVLARFDTEEMTLRYCNAGHNPPFLISGDRVRRLSEGGMVAGLFEDPSYEEEIIPLQRGDLIVFYTDGVIEAENAGGEQFEEDRLLRLLRGNAFLTADDIRDLVVNEVSQWTAGQDQKDDITVVTLKVG